MQGERGKYNLTQGPILNKLLVVAVPIMGTQLLQMLYNLTDMFWLGRVGPEAVAASGSAGMYLWLSMAFMVIGRMGAEIGVAQCMGRGDMQRAREYAHNSLFLAVVLGIGFSAVMLLFRHPLVGFFNIQDAGVVADTTSYLVITSLGIPATFISGAVTGMFNASGNSRISFLVNAVGLVANMVLDPVFIFRLGLGVNGAAIATSGAQWLVALLFLLAIKAAPGRPFPRFPFFAKPRVKRLRQIFKWCIPIALENMFFTFLSMLITRFVNAFGTSAMAVQRVGSQIESLTWLIGGGFSSAVTAFIGQNYGAGRWSRIRKGYSIAIKAMLVWGTAITLLLFFFGGRLFSLFLPDPELVAMGNTYLRILATCQVVACLEFTSAGAFRGIGRTLPPSIVSIVSNSLRVPLAWALGRTALGLDGIWLGIVLGAMLRGLWIFLWYQRSSRSQPREDVPVEAMVAEAAGNGS